MKQMLLILCVPLILYILYIRGYAPISIKRAMMFLGRRKNNMLGASCTACSGFIQYAMPLEQGKKYKFDFESEVTDGNITVEILHKGRTVYTFSGKSRHKIMEIEKGIYAVKTRYNKASGVYTFVWSEKQ